MKFSVSSEFLLGKLLLGSGAISPNPVLPVIEDYLFELSDNVLMITSTNMETIVITELEVQGERDGRIAVQSNILLDTLKGLPDQPISFDLNTDNNVIELVSAYGKYKLAGDNPEDFPKIPSAADTKTVSLTSSIISRAIVKTAFATSNDELRLAMTGIYTKIDFNKIIFVATDAHKLVKYTFGNISSEHSNSFIIPKKGLSLLRNIFKDSDAEIEMSFNNNNVFFQQEENRVIIRLIDDDYPDYNMVIPVNNTNILTIERKALLSSLKRINVYANKTTNQAIFNITDGSLTISAQDLDFSNEATEQLSCAFSGEDMTIGFNAKFLVEMLNVIDSDEVIFELAEPNKAGILIPAEQKDNETLLMLAMPVITGR